MANLKEQSFSPEGRLARIAPRVRDRLDRASSFEAKVELVTAQYPVEERQEITELLRILAARA